MNRKINLALICGGFSGEAVISKKSTAAVAKNINRDKYNVYIIQIDRKKWFFKHENKKYEIDKNDFSLKIGNRKIKFDVVFNMIHGSPGENGLMQSYFELLNIPHTSCNSAVSNLTFNKFYTLQLVRSLGITTNRSVYFNNSTSVCSDEVEKNLNFPVFIKPNCGGSSIGMSKVEKKSEVVLALKKAFREDSEVLVEEFAKGDELTCGVLRINGVITALPITQIVSKNDFFDYEAKYIKGMSDEITPALVSQQKIDDVVNTSKFLYEKMNCSGVVRFDYIHNGEKAFFLEVNTVPGMSSASIVPKQAKCAGISEMELYDIIISNAIKR